MADVSWLFNALAGADKSAAESSPFAPMKQTSSQLTSSILQAAPGRSAKDVMIASLLTGLFGGLSDRLDDSYRDNQNVLARDLMNDYLAGKPIERPSGMDPSVFAGIERAGRVFTAGRELETKELEDRAKIQTQQAINQAKALGPIQLDLDKQRRIAEIEATRDAYGGLGSIATLPPALQGDALKQQAVANKTAKSLNYVEEQFNKAKDISSIGALFPGTTAANAMNGISTSLALSVQNVLGAEPNPRMLEQIQSMAPDWNDTKDQIEAKKKQFKAFVASLAESTPLIGNAVTLPTTPSVGDAGATVPGIGQLFNGEKVLKVTRIK